MSSRMLKLGLTAFLVLIVCYSPVFGETKLIPVTPQYQDPPSAPSGKQSDQMADPLPSPRDQMYVFWIAGRLLSYPFDAIESLLSKAKNSIGQRKMFAPASAPGQDNPFSSMNWREIPPAPPFASDKPKQ